jgi:hypothetical protein
MHMLFFVIEVCAVLAGAVIVSFGCFLSGLFWDPSPEEMDRGARNDYRWPGGHGR